MGYISLCVKHNKEIQIFFFAHCYIEQLHITHNKENMKNYKTFFEIFDNTMQNFTRRLKKSRKIIAVETLAIGRLKWTNEGRKTKKNDSEMTNGIKRAPCGAIQLETTYAYRHIHTHTDHITQPVYR